MAGPKPLLTEFDISYRGALYSPFSVDHLGSSSRIIIRGFSLAMDYILDRERDSPIYDECQTQ